MYLNFNSLQQNRPWSHFHRIPLKIAHNHNRRKKRKRVFCELNRPILDLKSHKNKPLVLAFREIHAVKSKLNRTNIKQNLCQPKAPN